MENCYQLTEFAPATLLFEFFATAVIAFEEGEDLDETTKPDLGWVGLACFDESGWLPPTPRPALTVNRLLN